MRIISRFCNYLSYLFAANLAQSLKFTDAFTVEGWIKPVRTKSSPEMQVLFSTRVDIANGWHLTFWRNKNNDGKTYLTLYAYNASVLVSDFEMSGDLPSLQDWTHVALSYDPAEGKGTWRSYVNGVLAGTTENAAAPTLTTGYSSNLYFAGRATEHCFYGCMDAVRVSGAALTPDQLLCGTNGETAPSPLALWPLDAVNGMIFNGKDIKGSYSFVMDWGQTTIEGRDKFAFRAVCAEFVLARRTADALVGDSSGLHC